MTSASPDVCQCSTFIHLWKLKDKKKVKKRSRIRVRACLGCVLVRAMPSRQIVVCNLLLYQALKCWETKICFQTLEVICRAAQTSGSHFLWTRFSINLLFDHLHAEEKKKALSCSTYTVFALTSKKSADFLPISWRVGAQCTCLQTFTAWSYFKHLLTVYEYY